MNKQELIELLNKYTTTSLEWIKDAHGKDQKVIDPMDYYKIEKEFLHSHPEPERKTVEGEIKSFSVCHEGGIRQPDKKCDDMPCSDCRFFYP